VRHHAVSLGRLTERNRPGLADAVAKDYRTAPITERERAFLGYAEKLTRTPWEMDEGDVQSMRAAGLGDRDILDVNLITCYFAYANRLVDGLGVDIEGDDEVIGW
jgi:uncharacterized peroxidase-related enzyme